MGRSRPEVWISDRYGGQQELAARHQVCLAHVLRDVQSAIDRGDVAFAPKLRELLCWTIRIGKRRETLRDTTLVSYHARAERRLDHLLAIPPTGNAGRELQAQVKVWRGVVSRSWWKFEGGVISGWIATTQPAAATAREITP